MKLFQSFYAKPSLRLEMLSSKRQRPILISLVVNGESSFCWIRRFHRFFSSIATVFQATCEENTCDRMDKACSNVLHVSLEELTCPTVVVSLEKNDVNVHEVTLLTVTHWSGSWCEWSQDITRVTRASGRSLCQRSPQRRDVVDGEGPCFIDGTKNARLTKLFKLINYIYI